MSASSSQWSVDSWRSKPIKQQPDYHDKPELQKCLDTIRDLPPLVHQYEVDSLKQQLAECATGKRFLLQGGDCAERFADCRKGSIEAKLKVLLQMSLCLSFGAKMPTVRIGRVAGQYGKPRSSPIEKTPDGKTILSFKGDNINGFEATDEARRHDPQRLVQGHFYSAATLNYIRSLIKGGYADLRHSKHWDLGGVRDLSKRTRYQEIARSILDSLEFLEACGIQNEDRVKEVDFFTSHEGLVLDYESAVTKKIGTKYYNLGAHFLWIGNRTRDLDGAHIEYFRGIANPVGLKIDNEISPQELIDLIQKLNPTNEPGKIVLITRFGAKKLRPHLSNLIKAVQDAQLIATWTCDPMHGNTYTTSEGIKTRDFANILAEVTETFTIHIENGSKLHGVHFELTGEHVTECVGGPENLHEDHLKLRYTTYCDPRMNYLQGLEMSFLLAGLISKNTLPRRRNSEDIEHATFDEEELEPSFEADQDLKQ